MKPKKTYSLWRQDDNGVIARVARYPDKQSAEQARQHYDATGHKQHYWIAADDDAEGPATDR